MPPGDPTDSKIGLYEPPGRRPMHPLVYVALALLVLIVFFAILWFLDVIGVAPP
jgi:hypothetical protein